MVTLFTMIETMLVSGLLRKMCKGPFTQQVLTCMFRHACFKHACFRLFTHASFKHMFPTFPAKIAKCTHCIP